MSILGMLFGNNFGGGGQQAKPDWGQIEKLMKLETELNRTNRQGIFGGWDWTENPDGSWTQNQNLAPGMQAGADRLMNRAVGGEGMGNYQSPVQFSQMLDAAMANQMERRGMTPGYQTPEQAGYGPSSASQRPQQGPPPPQAGPPQQLPQPPPQGPPQQGPGPGGDASVPQQGGGMFDRLTAGQQGSGSMAGNAMDAWKQLQGLMR